MYFTPITIQSIVLPLYSSSVSAGFPSPAEDYIEKGLDLNEFLIKHPAATFFVKVAGNSMIDAGIQDKDILIVDRSIEPAHGKIVIAVIDGGLTVKRLHIQKQKIYLMPENPEFSPILVNPENGITIWGVVTHIIHSTL
ncbi:MAG: translesion error-prone DNA polymerase V autoproteolytic subunit [Proteobacteria bacterium]|nr:translesion error-prone DNA polymerase V autoproteolytic subunit [Pseudomonadota bacterium]